MRAEERQQHEEGKPGASAAEQGHALAATQRPATQRPATHSSLARRSPSTRQPPGVGSQPGVAGIQTSVLELGEGIRASAMNRMATAGGTGAPYGARSAADLDTALDAIAAEIIPASCTIQLEGEARPAALPGQLRRRSADPARRIARQRLGLRPRHRHHHLPWRRLRARQVR